MKRSNVLGLIGAIAAIAVAVALISWFLSKGRPTLLQGETEVTSYKASSKASGRVERMLVEEGQTVSKGELLYVLSIPEIEAKVRQARAAEAAAAAQSRKARVGARSEDKTAAYNLWQQAESAAELARKTYERVSNLYREGVVSAQNYDEALAAYNATKAQAAAARSQYDLALDGARVEDKDAAAALVDQAAGAVSEAESIAQDAYVYSPVDGEISSVIAQEGELIGQGYPVVTVLDMNDIWVEYNIKETLLPKIRKGMKFTAYVPALDRDVEFYVDYIAVQADFATWSATKSSGTFDIRTFTVKTRPTSYVEGLRPGMSAIMNWDELP